jgi:hypothetical protein
MLLRNTASLALLIFLFTFATGIAEAKTSSKTPKSPQKKWADIDGFRSAKFNMNEKQVTRAIGKDFKISRKKIKRSTHLTEQTLILEITVPNLMSTGGDAQIAYIFGQKSKKLMQVNVVWGKGVTKDVNPKGVVAVANLLRGHFQKRRYQEDMVSNGKINDSTMIVFRGRDKKGRMILLIMNTPVPQEGQNASEVAKNIQLRLAYKLNPASPDILTIKDGDF